MQDKIKDIDEKNWVDAGVILLIALFVGGGLLIIKKSDVTEASIEIIEPEGIEEAINVNVDVDVDVKGAAEVDGESGTININTASQERLEELPGIGAKTAEKIVDYRDEYGSFGSIEDIMEVKGIGEGKFEDIEELITVE